jgi:hypothetical protein
MGVVLGKEQAKAVRAELLERRLSVDSGLAGDLQEGSRETDASGYQVVSCWLML